MDIPVKIEFFLHATDEDSCDISVNIYFNGNKVFSKRFFMKQNTQTNIKYKIEIS